MRKVLVFLGGQSSLGEKGTPEWAPPSTLIVFKNAKRNGIDVEIDLRISKDKHIVVFHDATVDRRTDGTGSVVDKTLKELKQLDAGTWFHPKFKGLKILTFQEVLTLFLEDKERVIDAHLKETMSGYEEKAVKMVESLKMVDRVQFHSYSHSPSLVKTVKEVNSRIKVGFDCGGKSNSHHLIEMIETFPWIDFIWIQENKESFWITEELVSEIHRRQKRVIVSAKPSPPLRWEQLIDMGIDGINCDSPLYAKKYVDEVYRPILGTYE